MRWVLVVGLGIAVSASKMALAQFVQPGDQNVAQCVLQYTGDTRSNAAVQMIRNTCNDLYHPLGLATDSRQQYDMCLLQHLSGAQSDTAVAQIQSSCSSIYPRM